MKELYEKIIGILRHNTKVIENYFFMTILQILNSFFYLIIYPYLIHTLGTESYGLYVFAYSIIWYFITIVSFGFDMPAVKAIAENSKDNKTKEKVLSCIFTAKIYLEIISLLIFTGIILTIPIMRSNWIIYYILFTITLTNILFPQWYFQGMQKMRMVTLIQLGYKLLSLPIIFLLVKSADDLWIFATIIAASSLSGAFTAMIIIRFKENLKISLQPFSELKSWYKDGLPFFLSLGGGILKEQSVVQIIGIFLGMSDVAIYDLANKIILLPRALLSSVNGAIFPKIITNLRENIVKQIMRAQIFIGLAVIAAVAIFGKFAVKILGGITMLNSYPVAIILSITVLMYLVVGTIHYFIFIPKNKYYYITQNQIVAIAVFVSLAAIGLFYFKNVYILAVAMALSSVSELVFCSLLTNKLKNKKKK